MCHVSVTRFDRDRSFHCVVELGETGKWYVLTVPLVQETAPIALPFTSLGSPADSRNYPISVLCSCSGAMHNIVFSSNFGSGEIVISVTLTVTWLLVPDGLVCIFQKLLVSWGCLWSSYKYGGGKTKPKKNVQWVEALQVETPSWKSFEDNGQTCSGCQEDTETHNYSGQPRRAEKHRNMSNQ